MPFIPRSEQADLFVKARPPAQSRALLELADRLSPKIRRQFLAAVDRIKSRVDWRAVNAAIESGDVNGALKSMGMGRWASEFGAMTDVMTSAFTQSGVQAAKLAASGLAGGKITARFDAFHPRAAEAAFRNNYGLVQGFVDEQRRRLRGVIESAVRSGEAPITTSRQIRSSVRAFGLDDRRAEALSRYRDQLENGRFGDAASRAVGGNAERTLNAASSGRIELSQARINELVDQYEQRLLMQRAGAIADTESMRAVSQGAREGWEQVFDQSGVDRDNVLRFWVATNDERTRDSHREIPMINDEGVGMNEPYQLPDGGTIMFPHDPEAPPEETINCRCTEVYRLADVPESILPEAVAGRSILPVAKEDPGLYVCRYLTVASALALQEYAKSLGLTNLVPPHKMHVTVLYSSKSIPVQPQGTVVPAKPITMPQPLGKDGAMVLFLDSPEVSARHDALMRAGAKHDYPEFQPHVTLSYDAGTYDPGSVEVKLPPEKIMLGFEAAAPLNRDWAKDEGLKKEGPTATDAHVPSANWNARARPRPRGRGMRIIGGQRVKKYNPDQPRDDHGRFGEGGGGSAMTAPREKGWSKNGKTIRTRQIGDTRLVLTKGTDGLWRMSANGVPVGAGPEGTAFRSREEGKRSGEEIARRVAAGEHPKDVHPGIVKPPATIDKPVTQVPPPAKADIVDTPSLPSSGKTGYGQTTAGERAYHDKYMQNITSQSADAIRNTGPVRVFTTSDAEASFYRPGHARFGAPSDPLLQMNEGGYHRSSLENEIGATWAHEYGHHVDSYHGEFSPAAFPDMVADTQMLRQNNRMSAGVHMREHVEELSFEQYTADTGLDRESYSRFISRAEAGHPDAYKDIAAHRVQASARGDARMFGDYLGSVTDNQYGYGHSAEYYWGGGLKDRAKHRDTHRTGPHAHEAWANYFQAHSNGKATYRYAMKKLTPNTYARYSKSMEDIANGKRPARY